jgi:hypothetical protein
MKYKGMISLKKSLWLLENHISDRILVSYTSVDFMATATLCQTSKLLTFVTPPTRRLFDFLSTMFEN